MEPNDGLTDAPTRPPVDVAHERQRLIEEATRRGVDIDAALELAEKLGHLEPLADAYRSVERRLASGMTLEGAEEVLLA